MKRTLLLTVLSAALLLSTRSQAQVPVVNKILPEVVLGIKVGANFSQLTGNSFDNAYKAGFHGGAFVGVTKGKIGVQGEVLVRSCTYAPSSIVAAAGGQDVATTNLDIPVLFEYKLISRLWIQLGPQFSSLISAKSNGTDVKKTFNSTDFSGVVGLQAILPVHLVAGARYVLGMTNINNESVSGTKESWNNRSIQLYVGFRFL